MLRVAQDDLDAYEQLVRSHERRVIGLAYRYLGDSAAAEDLAQEIFLTVFEGRKKYTPTAKFSTFLYRITVNRCLNAIRDRRAHLSLVPEAAGESSETGRAEAGETQARVMEEIGKLPDQQRIALILFQFDDLPYEEIAAAMNTSLSSVKSLIFRARETLRQRLADLM
jgi:RNA polymerase sigma-70 factor (ECF subfamily)